MKKRMKINLKNKALAGVLCTAVLLGMTACNAPGSSKKELVELKAGETYSITDVPFYEMDEEWTFTSDDANIAEVVGSNIVAYSPGVATITADMGKNDVVYEVTVSEDEDARLLSGVQDVKNEYAYLGVGYNALKQTGFITLNKTQTRAIINSDAIKAAIDNGQVKGDDSQTQLMICIQGDSDENYTEDYAKQINGNLNLNIKGVVSGVAKGNYKNTNNTSKNTKTVYNTVISYDQRQAYWLESNLTELSELTQMNEGVWRSLTGEDGTTPEEFFENYGTHVVTRVYLGGRMELNYKLSSTSASVKTEDLLDISGKINANLGAVKGSAEAQYCSNDIKTAKSSGMKMETTASVYGGKAPFISSVESFNEKHAEWRDSINSKNLTFIGTDDAGLVPVWLLLDREKYGERRQQFMEAYSSAMHVDLSVVNDINARVSSEEATEATTEAATEATTEAIQEESTGEEE